MKTIRIYDRRGCLLREFTGAVTGSVGMNGALVIRCIRPTLQEQAHGTPTYPAVVVIAPGQWHSLEEWDDTPPDTALEARPAAELPPTRTDIGIVRRPNVNEPRFPPPNRPTRDDPDSTAVYDDLSARAARAAQFFAVICKCAQLRCPVEIDPPAMPGWLPQTTVPRQQCSWEIGHDATETPHAWELHGWPYGINEHHPKCPRYPNPDTTSGDIFTTDVRTRAQLAVEMLTDAGHPDAATNLREALTYSREPDDQVTGGPIPAHVEGHHVGERAIPVIPGQRHPGTMTTEG